MAIFVKNRDENLRFLYQEIMWFYYLLSVNIFRALALLQIFITREFFALGLISIFFLWIFIEININLEFSIMSQKIIVSNDIYGVVWVNVR